MGILAGKRILVTGVITDASIAFHVARVAQAEGATVVLTGFGRVSLVERIAKRLPSPPPVLELDVTNDDHLASLTDRLSEHVDGLDGVLHAIAYANPEEALGGNFLHTKWPDVARAVQVSAYSLKALTNLFCTGSKITLGEQRGHPTQPSNTPQRCSHHVQPDHDSTGRPCMPLLCSARALLPCRPMSNPFSIRPPSVSAQERAAPSAARLTLSPLACCSSQLSAPHMETK